MSSNQTFEMNLDADQFVSAINSLSKSMEKMNGLFTDQNKILNRGQAVTKTHRKRWADINEEYNLTKANL